MFWSIKTKFLVLKAGLVFLYIIIKNINYNEY